MILNDLPEARLAAALTPAQLATRARKSLKTLGYAAPADRLRAMRHHLAEAALHPPEAVTALMRSHRFIGLGEMHDFAGRYLLAELVTAAAAGGAQWLFIEVYRSSQGDIDAFVASGCHRHLPVSAGGGDDEPMRFQQPYVEMLLAARASGLRIVAVDVDNAGYDERNRAMACAIAQCLSEPGSRGVAVMGQLHLVPRSIFGFSDSLATLLRSRFGAGEVITVGRAVPDVAPEFSVWSDVAAVSRPHLMLVRDSPFADLAATHGQETLVGSDFDYLLFYARDAVLP